MASEIFLFYAGCSLAMCVVSGIALLILRRLVPAAVEHAFKAYQGWLVIVPVTFGSIFLGREATIVLFTIVAIIGFKEFARITGLYRDWLMTGVVYVGIACVGVVCLVDDPNLRTTGWFGLFTALPAFVIAAIMLVPVVRNQAKGQLQNVAMAVVGFIYIGWMFGHLSFLANADNAYGYLLFLMFAVALNDVAAYMCGKLICKFTGKHALRSNISPNKTWEGSMGALVFSMGLPWLLWFSIPDFTPRELILTGLIVGIGGQVGDLSISLIKRDVGVKDTGAILKGHGGILDRIDSLIYTAPLFFHMAAYFHKMQ